MTEGMGSDGSMAGYRFLVFGGTGGIGEALVRRLVRRGASVVVAARGEERLAELARATGVLTETVDVTRSQEVDDLVREVAAGEEGLAGMALAVGSILIRPAHLTSPPEGPRASLPEPQGRSPGWRSGDGEETSHPPSNAPSSVPRPRGTLHGGLPQSEHRAMSVLESEAPEPTLAPPRVVLTPAAVAKVREMLEEEDLLEEGGLRISGHTGAGCSAPMQFGLILEEFPESDDIVMEGAGIRIFMDPTSAWGLDGLQVDYLDSPGMGEGFAFRHPRGAGGRAC